MVASHDDPSHVHARASGRTRRGFTLVSASGTSPATAGGSFGSRTYGYDARSNRNAYSDEVCSFNLANHAGAQVDQWLSITSACSGALYGYGYTYDSDGRATAKNWPNDHTGTSAWYENFSYGPNVWATEDSVFKSVTVGNSNGTAVYTYYMDAFGRRVLKSYPAGGDDTYYYNRANQLLSDQGLDSTTSPNNHPEEDYVWLGGRPVAVIRGEFDANWNRLSDWASCTRNGDGSACGAYFPVTDHIGKPVLMLDGNGKIAGAADYDPYGSLNRVAVDWETPHPYTVGHGTYASPNFTQASISGTTVQVRGYFGMVDGWGNGCNGDSAEIVDPNNGNAQLWYGPEGQHQGRQVTPWVTPAQSSTAPSVW